ncbi:MAG TPA: M20/M25/M40 family metallo-hydrolase [Myxococcota bacterium]|nr:M20/M25/M40 family metallo-hydrolase [Myxococcota bacterium]
MFLLWLACEEAPPETSIPTWLAPEVVDAVSMERVKAHVDVLADDSLGGRIPGSYGHSLAQDYLLGELQEIGLEPLGSDGYRQDYVSEPVDGRFQLLEDGTVADAEDDHGTNLVALLPGSDPELADQHIVVMAHYDHLGVNRDGEVYNGAFDDATSVAVLLELARVLVEEEVELGRSIVFLLTDDEESGLEGAEWFLADELVPHSEISFAIALDPIGRGVLPDYWPLALMGLERSPDLLASWKEVCRYAETTVSFVHRDTIPLFASDQDEFYRLDDPIPAVWFTSPGMAFYHTVDDTPETIDYRSVRPQARFLLQALAWFAQKGDDYAYEGPPELAPEHAADARALVAGYLGSEHLSDSERAEVESILHDLDAIIEADNLDVVDNPEGLFVYAMYYLVFELPGEHIGEIPPPFPEDG